MVFVGEWSLSTWYDYKVNARYMTRAFLLVFFVILVYPAHAGDQVAGEMKAAQAALSEGDYDSAFVKFKQLAVERKNPLAQFTLALFYDNGWGRPVDRSAACQWYEEAAEAEIPAALHMHAECLAAGVNLQPAPLEAAKWYERAAEHGHTISLCALAELYMHGRGVVKDPAKGLDYCLQAAQKNSPSAQLQTARYLLEGDESIRDIVAANDWFRNAAERGSLEGAYYLGLINRDHLNDAAASIYWFEHAASQGYLASYYPTAKSYFDSLMLDETRMPSAPNLAKAYMWLSATIARSNNPDENIKATKMLSIVQEVMPTSWASDLNQKVVKHLAAYDQNQE